MEAEETRQKYKEIYDTLAERGFAPLDGSECSMGKCHTTDEKHYILLTDGLIIYSNIPYYNQKKYHNNAIVRVWYYDQFQSKQLDEVMEFVYFANKLENSDYGSYIDPLHGR